MRILAEIAVILLLLFLGWRQSYRGHLSRLFPDRLPAAPALVAATPGAATPLPAGAPVTKTTPPAVGETKRRFETWLWEPKPMDKPYKDDGTGRVPRR